ncbi:hypothetical protein BDP27DRAFT_514291 [Rhodocollybia butyracea]|uniref:Uncharacterized protein n=1 Tax=Rhodocollybia butyracea TaxID=206335 RepID=A0A9P5TYJ3_9AGAR|nr:hypothetical protein BDP27DRAFT_514291 [Rhodocollybia butyracea]
MTVSSTERCFGQSPEFHELNASLLHDLYYKFCSYYSASATTSSVTSFCNGGTSFIRPKLLFLRSVASSWRRCHSSQTDPIMYPEKTNVEAKRNKLYLRASPLPPCKIQTDFPVLPPPYPRQRVSSLSFCPSLPAGHLPPRRDAYLVVATLHKPSLTA